MRMITLVMVGLMVAATPALAGSGSGGHGPFNSEGNEGQISILNPEYRNILETSSPGLLEQKAIEEKKAEEWENYRGSQKMKSDKFRGNEQHRR